MNVRVGPCYHCEGVAGAEVVQGSVETGAVAGGPGDGVGGNSLDADAGQTVGLSVQVLIGGADAGVAHNLSERV